LKQTKTGDQIVGSAASDELVIGAMVRFNIIKICQEATERTSAEKSIAKAA